MTDTPNSKILNAVIILLIVLILVIVSSILSEKYNINIKQYLEQPIEQHIKPKPIEQHIENFANYQDVKTKTINWCKKMLSVGLLTPDQYDKCIGTFKDVTAGVLPKEFPIPDTGLGRNYSLYNTKSKDNSGKLSSSITGGNTNNIMLVTQSGLYMGCKPDNTIYFIKNVNDSTINQKELYFTLVPQTSDVYAIMSPYERYLIANTNPSNDNTVPVTTIANLESNNAPINMEWTASFTGTEIGPMSSWTVSKINENTITFESIQYNGFYMSFNDTNNLLDIIYGNNDSAMWVMIPEEQTKVNNKFGEYTGVEFIVRGENILQKFKTVHIKIMSLNIMKKGLIKLQDTIRANYTSIAKYIQGKLDAVIGLYKQDINTVLNKITNTRDYYLQQINSEISNINIELSNLSEGDVSIEYNQYLMDLEGELNSVKVRIGNNNKIMGRQQDNYEIVNKEYEDINKKTKMFKKTDETSKLNIDLVNNYTAQKSYLLKLYPFIILILGLASIYLTYSTIMKFKINIYDKY